MFSVTRFVALSSALIGVFAQVQEPPFDGNPHQWNRLRRCDLSSHYNNGGECEKYKKGSKEWTECKGPCGLCEGLGGKVWSDDVNDIQLPYCQAVATHDQLIAAESELKQAQRQAENSNDDISNEKLREAEQKLMGMGGPSPKKPPTLDKTWKNTRFSQILIADKTNPMCVGGFPGPDSTKTHCYTPNEGVHYYDAENTQLRYDLTNKGGLITLGANTTTTIIHKNEFMWIMNDLIDAVGFKQCICSNPGIHVGEKIYPINYDFLTKDSKYLGRERLGVEYVMVDDEHIDKKTGENAEPGEAGRTPGTTDGKVFLVDHWLKAPHHLWVDVKTGRFVRMWQPWNGLQIFDPKYWVFGPDAKVYDGNAFFPGKAIAVDGGGAKGGADVYGAVPPEMCKAVPTDPTIKKALMRIHCDDGGNNDQGGIPSSSGSVVSGFNFMGKAATGAERSDVPTDAEANAAIFA